MMHFKNLLWIHRMHIFVLPFVTFASIVVGILPIYVNASQQCNLGLKLYSVENGNAVCAALAAFQCIELCEWVEADNGGCTHSSHYNAFRGRRTHVGGMVLTEGSFLVQCCASLATAVLLDAEQEPICRWSEQIETVVDRPTVRFQSPLGELEYLRDLRGTRVGRGAAKIQAEICRFFVQRTNCDRKKMSPEDAHQYSLQLLRLQRARDFFQNSRNGIINAGSSPPISERERARAEHRIIHKNNTKSEQLELLTGEEEEAGEKHSPRQPQQAKNDAREKLLLKAAAAALEEGNLPVDGEIVQQRQKSEPRLLVDGMSGGGSGASTPNPAVERIIYNDRRHRTHQHDTSVRWKTPASAAGVPPSQPILREASREANAPQVARGVRELLYRAAKQGSTLLKKLNKWRQEQQNFNVTQVPRPPMPVRRLRAFPRAHWHPQHRHHTQREQKQAPVRMEMSRLGWPKGLRRRLWPVLATNTTRELIPTRTDLNWVDNDEFFDGSVPGAMQNAGVSGTVRVVDGHGLEPKRVRMDRIRPPASVENTVTAGEGKADLRIRKLPKNVVSNGPDGSAQVEEEEELAPREKLTASGGLDGAAAGGGGSFEPEVPPKQQQILPFHAIKEISTSPLGRAPPFRIVPFAQKKGPSLGQVPSKYWWRREGQVQQPNSANANGSQLAKLLECCQQQAPGCRTLCTRDLSKEQIKQAMSSGQCPPLSITSVLQCFPRFYNISSVGQCCAADPNTAADDEPLAFVQAQQVALPTQCLSLCGPDFRLSFAHLACVDHSERILSCYRQLIERVDGDIGIGTGSSSRHGQFEDEVGQIGAEQQPPPFAA